jgi:hypothetical protein
LDRGGSTDIFRGKASTMTDAPLYLSMNDLDLQREIDATKRTMTRAKERGMVRGVKACRLYLRELVTEGNRRTSAYWSRPGGVAKL